MPNFFKRAAKYANASANAKLEARADPRIQIEQALEEAQKQHQALSRQAASVIGNVKAIELKLGRQMEEEGKAKSSAAKALQIADQARSEGDSARAASMEKAAQSFAGQLVSLDESINDLKHLHEQAQTQALQARAAVDDSAQRLQGFLAQRSQLMTQLESAKMQEQVASSLESVSKLAAPGNVPSLDQVRDKIEGRYAQAIGRSDLASGSLEARQLEVEHASLDGAAALKLEEIRASLSAPPAHAAISAGTAASSSGAATDDNITDITDIPDVSLGQPAPPAGE